jgi:hypothetical protein
VIKRNPAALGEIRWMQHTLDQSVHIISDRPPSRHNKILPSKLSLLHSGQRFIV